MPSRSRSKREQRDALTRRLRAEGLSWAQVAARIQVAEHVNRRVAMRLAHGWTQWEVARRWNERWPADGGGAGITDQVISYWETWPQSGREPSVKTLCRLALIYQCSVGDLIDEEHYGALGGAHLAADEAPGADRAGGLAQLREDDPAIQVASAPHEITGAAGEGWWAKVPAPIPSGFAYRWKTEPDLDGSAAEREVMMAAHEAGEHAESAERRDIGDATLEQIRADVMRLSRDSMTREPFGLFREMRRVRARMYAALDRRLWPRDQTDLYFLLGCLNCLMAVTADGLGNTQAAEELIRAGWAYAIAIDHHALMAQLRLDLAGITYWSNRTRQSHDLAQSGLDYLAAGPNAAQLHLQVGRAAARLGDADSARRAITSATEAREREHSDELLNIGGEFGFSQATQHYLAGSTLIEIPQGETEAITELERAEALYAAGPEPGEHHSYRCEMITHANLATARLRAGQLDAAAAALDPVLTLPVDKRVRSLSERLPVIRTELARPRYQGSAEARDLDERIEAFLSDTIIGGLPPAS